MSAHSPISPEPPPDDLAHCRRQLDQARQAWEAGQTRIRELEERRCARDPREENAARLMQLVEELNAARQAAESANTMKSQFLANFSHEIRTPMNAIIGMTDVVLSTKVTPEQRRALSIVKSASEALLDLINGVLDLSKIEAGQFQLEPRAFDLRAAVEKTVGTLGLAATEKGLELICHLPPDLPKEVRGDPIRLRQILINLLGNALKFTPSGHIRCSCRLEAEENDECVLRFEVEDTGIGIPENKLDAIFEDFTQVDSSSTRVYGGTGLGLSIAKRLVGLMGGRITVTSAPGHGSTFAFTARMDRISPPDSTHANLFDGAATALVAANNPLLRSQIRELLSFWGLKSQLADCMECMVEPPGPFDLAIIDTDFGDFACLELLLPDGSLHAVPSIVLTHIGDQSLNKRTGQIKAVVTKPLLQDDLLRALAQVFGLRMHLPASEPEAPDLPPMRRLQILLVDDVATNRELAGILLGKMGHAVHDGRDGLDALTLLGRHRYDLVLMDLQMPIMDGFTATRIIRACEQGRPAPTDMDGNILIQALREKVRGTCTPIIAMTAHALLEDKERCMDIGMNDYLTKPLRLDEVHAALTRIAGPADASPRDGPRPLPEPAPPAQAPTPATDGVVQRALAALQTQYGLEHDEAMPLVDSLAASLTEHLAGLEECRSSADPDQLRHHAHGIKGLLLNMGLAPEGAVAKEVEELAQSGGRSDLERGAGELLQMATAILEDINTARTAPHDEEAS